METIEFYGSAYPIMKLISKDEAVVATLEGPAIYSVRHHSISALWIASGRVSKEARDKAIEAVVKWCADQPTYPGKEAANA